MSRLLSEKVAVIVGGSRGIGLAAARAIASRGAQVLIADLPSASLDRAVAEINSRRGRHSATAIETDVTSAASVRSLARRSIKVAGKVDILVNAAGVMLQGIVGQTRCRDWMRMLDINLLGAVRSSTEFLPSMLARNSGHIVNMVPVGGLVPGDPATIAYDSGYAALIVFTHGLDRQLQGTGIHVSMYVLGLSAPPIGAGRDAGPSPGAAERFTDRLLDGLEHPRFLILADTNDAQSLRRRWGEHELAGRLELALREA